MANKEPYRDAAWWKQFETAPPELKKAMHATMEARDELKLVKRLGLPQSRVLDCKQKIDELEQHERQLRNLHRERNPKASSFPSRKVQRIREFYAAERERNEPPVTPIDLDKELG
jgi:hypothetical protein